MSYLVTICVTPRPEVFDPQSQAVEAVINGQLGFTIDDLVIGRYCSYVSSQKTKVDVKTEADDLCEKLLYNPVIEIYEIMSIKRQRVKK